MEVWQSLLENYYWIIQILGIVLLAFSAVYLFKINVKKYKVIYSFYSVVLVLLNVFVGFNHFVG
ncbi:hypothetical protein JR536_002934 [Listeria monocytogenes]|uniref:hypothetical protein n=1 Tax=Listeria monocytogenes TaxID=1639 RepID=UPI00083E5B8D|nr:hypothetical protein [Listeria monocytogenes]EAC2557521.1 hypothetical protein [Listeria monocytogenes]EAC4520847.1 hypothetical protein [Listeria monocytogenes]EAE3700723.1 hypothetical protein [Listeria monocytogenes]EAE8113424.1 hypothetical protein [Listeria monocytogenes]EAE8116656.1 hypothetical protein [Listeria monocytogenes]